MDDFNEIEEEEFEIRRKIAVGYGFNFKRFKELVCQFITRNNNEDQWVFDYQSYCYALSENHYEHPLAWAKEYYQEDYIQKQEDELMNWIKNNAH